VISVGVDTVNSMKQGLISPKAIINLKTIPGLDGIYFDEENGVRIGALMKNTGSVPHFSFIILPLNSFSLDLRYIVKEP